MFKTDILGQDHFILNYNVIPSAMRGVKTSQLASHCRYIIN